MSAEPLRTPVPASGDSEAVVLALETARALEGRGDVEAAVRWLRRAANEAENQGNDARVLAIAHAAADLTSTLSLPPSVATLPSVRDPDPSEPTIRQSDFVPALPPPAPSPSRSISIACQLSISVDAPVSERTMRIGVIRVAIRKATPNAKCFSVEQLDADQEPPRGTTEAMLVVLDDSDASQESPAEQWPKGSRSKR